MTGIPDLTGSYVVGVCVEERRNGILYSKTRRDYEFNVVDCSENLVALLDSDSYLDDTSSSSADSIAYFESCDPFTIEFENLSGDENFIQDYRWEIRDPQGNLIRQEQGANQREISHTFVEEGLYTGLMILNDGGDCQNSKNHGLPLESYSG